MKERVKEREKEREAERGVPSLNQALAKRERREELTWQSALALATRESCAFKAGELFLGRNFYSSESVDIWSSEGNRILRGIVFLVN
jgi:hypothetical protein